MFPSNMQEYEPANIGEIFNANIFLFLYIDI